MIRLLSCSLLVLLLGLCCVPGVARAQQPVLKGSRFVLHADFPGTTPPAWRMRTPTAWAVIDDSTRTVLQLHAPSANAHELEYTYLCEHDLADYTLGCTARPAVLTPTPEIEIRFALQNENDYAFLRIEHGAPQHTLLGQMHNGNETILAATTTHPVDFSPSAYHTLKLAHHSLDRTITAYLDDMTTPLLVASDVELPAGRLALGTRRTIVNLDRITLIGTVARDLP